MSVISFDDWKKKKESTLAFNSRGGLREDVALKEDYGFDLCVLISAQLQSPNPDPQSLDQLWKDLDALTAQLPHEHAWHYFSAFKAFCAEDADGFIKSFDLFLQSEKILYVNIANSDWWLDCFLWVFSPALPGMYSQCADLFFRYWPKCAMGYVCEGLEWAEDFKGNGDRALKLFFFALMADAECYVAHYYIGVIYCEKKLYKSALHYFEKAAASTMYSNDPAFYFEYAWAAEKAGRLAVAQAMYKSSLALDDRYPSAMNNLGCVLMRDEKYDEALKIFATAINLGLDSVLPYKNTVASYIRQNKLKECMEFIAQHSAKLGQQFVSEAEYLAATMDSGAPLPPLPDYGAQEDASFSNQLIADEVEKAVIAGSTFFGGRKLKVFEDEGGYGRMYYIRGHDCADLMCVDEKDKELLVMMIYNSTADMGELSSLAAMANTLNAQEKHLKRKIVACLLCRDVTSQLMALYKRLRRNPMHRNIELYRFGFAFEPIVEE